MRIARVALLTLMVATSLAAGAAVAPACPATVAPPLEYDHIVADYGESYHAPAPGDFNHDGIIDGAMCHWRATYTASLYYTSPDGVKSRTRVQAYATGSRYGFRAVAGDFNGDGDLDVGLSTYYQQDRMHVFFGDGTGALSAYTIVAYGPRELASNGRFDINSDGSDDFIFGERTGSTAGGLSAPPAADRGAVFWMEGGSWVVHRVTAAAPTTFTPKLDAGLLDADDSLIDIAYVYFDAATLFIVHGPPSLDYYNDGVVDTVALPGIAASIAVLDFNSDAQDDVVVGIATGEVLVFLGPDPSTKQPITLTLADYHDVSVVDFNKDGVAEIVVKTTYGAVFYRVATLDPFTLFPGIPIVIPVEPANVGAYDTNGDSYIDITLVDNVHEVNRRSAISQPIGSIAPLPGLLVHPDAASALATADLDGDGWLDILTIAAATGSIHAVHNSGAGSLAAPVSLANATETGIVFSTAIVCDIDGDAALDIVALAPVSHPHSVFWLRAASTARTYDPPAVLTSTASVLTSPPDSLAAVSLNSLSDSAVDLVVASVASGSLATFISGAPAPIAVTDGVHAALVLASPLAPLYPPPPSTPPTTSVVYAVPATGAVYAGAVLLGSHSNAVGVTALALAQMDAAPGHDLVWAAPGLGGVAWASSTLDPTPANLFDLASPTIISFGGDVVDIAVVYATFDHMASIVGVLAGRTAASWAHPVSALASRLSNRVLPFATGGTALALPLLTDVSKDGLHSVVFSTSAGVVLLSQEFTFASAQASARILALDAPECGGIPHSVVCVAAALARVSQCTPFPPVLTLPPLPITNCATSGRPIVIAGHVVVRGANASAPALFNCAANGGGVLFSVAAGADVTLEYVDVVGASVSGPESPVVVEVGGLLTLSHASFRACSAAPPLLASEAGMGGAVRVLSQGTLVASHVVFADNTAAGSGGALAAVGDSVTLELLDVVFERNTALGSVGGINSGGGAVAVLGPTCVVSLTGVDVRDSVAAKGSGGAVLVRGASVVLTMNDVHVTSCTAGTAGGALAVVSGSVSTIDWLTGSATGTSAVWGGVIASASYDVFPLVPAAARLGTKTGTIGAALTLGASVAVNGGGATYGAFGFLCDSALSLPSWDNVTGSFAATIAGGRFFLCSDGPGAWTAGVAPSGPSTVSAAGYGSVDATPPWTVDLADPFPASAPSGADMHGAVVVRDAFGAVAIDATSTLSAAALVAGEVVVAVATSQLDAATGIYTVIVTASVVVWPDELDQAHTFSVSAGSGSDVAVTVVLTPCPAGTGRTGLGNEPLSCRPCTGTSFSHNVSTDPCDVPLTCAGTAMLVGSECVECPPLSVVAPNATVGVLDCDCIAGAWSDPAVVRFPILCIPCPIGGVCPGGDALPIAAAGYYPLKSAGEFTVCPVREACVGGGKCGVGYAPSFACKDCASGYHRVASGVCEKCPSRAYTLMVLLGVLLVGIASGSFVVSYLAVRRTLRMRSQSSSLVPYSVSVLLLWVQTVALLYSESMAWPSSVREALRVFTLANIDLSFFAVGCAGLSFPLLFSLKMLLPVVFAGAVVLNAVLYLAVRRRRGSEVVVGVRAVLVRLASVLVPFVYIPISRVTLQFFDCTKLGDGAWYMDADLNVECGSGEWMAMLPLAVAGFAVYVVGAPGCVAVALYTSRRRLESAHVRAKYGPLFASYKSEFYLFEMFQLVWKRLSVVVVTLFFSTIPVVLFSGLVLSFLTTLQVVTRLQPFRNARHNVLDARLALSLLVLSVLGIFFWADDFSSDIMFAVFVALTLAVLAGSLLLLVSAVIVDVVAERTLAAVAPSAAKTEASGADSSQSWGAGSGGTESGDGETVMARLLDGLGGSSVSDSSSSAAHDGSSSSSLALPLPGSPEHVVARERAARTRALARNGRSSGRSGRS